PDDHRRDLPPARDLYADRGDLFRRIVPADPRRAGGRAAPGAQGLRRRAGGRGVERMQLGIHLPQIGRKAGPDGIRRAAIQAEELATLQNLSQGRLILGAGVGWLEAEFAALGVPFRERGRRMDEGIAMMRAVWSDDPVSFSARYIPAVIERMRSLPRPEVPIPIWIGGGSEAAIRRALSLDGWHGSRTSPEEAAPIVRRLRAARPEPGFAISLRAAWDGKDEAALAARLDAYAAAGVGHVLVEPFDRTLDDWLRSVERIARAGAGHLA